MRSLFNIRDEAVFVNQYPILNGCAQQAAPRRSVAYRPFPSAQKP